MTTTWTENQRAHFNTHVHEHMRPSTNSIYADRIVNLLWSKVEPTGRGLEVGCGSGRFTMPWVRRGASLDAIDLSELQLRMLREEARREGLDGICAHRYSIEEAVAECEPGSFDYIIGFFILHHLEDLRESMRQLATLVRPGGRMGFVEPNRNNPLYTFQIALCRDISLREEYRLFELGARRLRRVVEETGMSRVEVTRHGFFPPQILNHIPGALSLEMALERVPWLESVLPFNVVIAKKPDRA